MLRAFFPAQTLTPEQRKTCALLADRHTPFVEGIRDLLRTEFNSVFVVADVGSLREGTFRLRPTVTVIDLAFAGGDLAGLIRQLRRSSPESKLIALTVDDQPAVARAIMTAGADCVVLKRCIARDLLPAVDAALAGGGFVTPDIETRRVSPVL